VIEVEVFGHPENGNLSEVKKEVCFMVEPDLSRVIENLVKEGLLKREIRGIALSESGLRLVAETLESMSLHKESDLSTTIILLLEKKRNQLLLAKCMSTSDSYQRGKLMEDFVQGLINSLNGFRIVESGRDKRTATEEVDFWVEITSEAPFY